jgi:hypothetical protein
VDNKQKAANPADCLPSCLAGAVAFATVDALNAVRIGKDKLCVLKANFVFSLILSVFGFIPDNPAFFHHQNVLHYALLVKAPKSNQQGVSLVFVALGFVRAIRRER